MPLDTLDVQVTKDLTCAKSKTVEDMDLLQTNHIQHRIQASTNQSKLTRSIQSLGQVGQILFRLDNISVEHCTGVNLAVSECDPATFRFDDSFDRHVCQLFIIIDRVGPELLNSQLYRQFFLESFNFRIMVPCSYCKLSGLFLVAQLQWHPVASSHGSGDLRLVR